MAYDDYNNFDFTAECWYKSGCTQYKERCYKSCHRYLEMNYLITNCGQPNASRYIKNIIPSPEDYRAFAELDEIRKNVLEFVSSGSNLYITSENMGNGKTTWALKIMYKYFDEIWPGNGFILRGYFVYVPEFITKLKVFSYRETTEFKKIDYHLMNANLVVWDDLTSLSLTDNEKNILTTYVNRRCQKGLANIFTGYYVDPYTLCDILGDILARRVNNSRIIKLLGHNPINPIKNIEPARSNIYEEDDNIGGFYPFPTN